MGRWGCVFSVSIEYLCTLISLICCPGAAITLDITAGIKYPGVWVSVVLWACRSTSSLNLFRRNIPRVLWDASSILRSVIRCRYGCRFVMDGRYGMMEEGKMHGCVGGQNGSKGSGQAREREKRLYNVSILSNSIFN